MHLPHTQSTKIDTTEGTIWDYEINPDIGVTYQQMHMRGPKSGRYLNTVCHEVYFILAGTATFVVGEERYQVKAKDVIVVKPNTPHHIETSDLTFLTITNPDWSEAQFKLVE